MNTNFLIFCGKAAGKISKKIKLPKAKETKQKLRKNDSLYIVVKTILAYKNDRIVKKAKIMSVKEYCELSSSKYRVIEPVSENEVCCPRYYSIIDEKLVRAKTKEIYVAEVKDASITGGSSILYSNGICLYDLFVDDIEDRISINFANVICKKGNEMIFSFGDEEKEYDTGISLLGFASYNYYHLTIEILSRMKYVDSIPEFRGYPIFIDAVVRTIPQYKQLLYAINVFNHPIIYVEENENVKVKNLIWPSYNTWMPINVRERNQIRVDDFVVASSALENIRETVKDYIKPIIPGKRIFISRKNTNSSRLDNEKEMRNLFRNHGFEIVDPVEMSFLDQVELFSSADVVAGASGAALTNVVYCNPGSTLLCFIPEEYDFYMYSTISKMVNMNSIFIDCRITDRTEYPATDVFKANLSDCIRVLEEELGIERVRELELDMDETQILIKKTIEKMIKNLAE